MHRTELLTRWTLHSSHPFRNFHGGQARSPRNKLPFREPQRPDEGMKPETDAVRRHLLKSIEAQHQDIFSCHDEISENTFTLNMYKNPQNRNSYTYYEIFWNKIHPSDRHL